MTDGSGQRIAPGGRADIGIGAWGFARIAGRVTRTEPPKLFLTLGRTRGLFWGWLHFAGRLMPGGSLPRRESELVILRVATLRSCDYERAHHERLGQRAGVTDADLDRIGRGPEADGWSPRERAILVAVDALHADQDLDDATWSLLRSHLGERQAIELLLLVGHYEMLATTLNTLRMTPDQPR